MIDDLRIEADHSCRVEKSEGDMWLELNTDVHYSDMRQDKEIEILAELKLEKWRIVIDKKYAKTSPWLHRIITDKGRSLFIDMLPLKAGGTYLDVGSGWGQIAIPLSRYGKVYCLDVTLSRLNILQEIAHQENAALNYICGNYLSFPFEGDQFDLVVFNGSLEWIALGAPDISIREAQDVALKKARRILKPDGFVYVGIENSLGLKYIMGAPDDHTGISGITYLEESEADALYGKMSGKGRLRAKTCSLSEYRKMFLNAGLEIVEIYGCFPDYKIIRQMIPLNTVNRFIMERGTLAKERSGADGSKLAFVDQMRPLYQLLAKNEIAHMFCPSYGIIAQKRQ